MSISPESRISYIPRIAMSGVALFSMAYKPDFKPSPTRTAHPEMTIIADPRLVSYSI